jgi:hypothetical protein
LLALRFPGACDPSAFAYTTDVPVFATGAEARAHGLRDIANPGPRAERMMEGLMALKKERKGR